MVASCVPPTGDLARNPGMCPDRELNWQPSGSQTGAQSTEPHEPELMISFRQASPPSLPPSPGVGFGATLELPIIALRHCIVFICLQGYLPH